MGKLTQTSSFRQDSPPLGICVLLTFESPTASNPYFQECSVLMSCFSPRKWKL
ncbi:hypothetical protein C0J52_09209 [Blattella germanica]|nr:hypothetical protein C0J52_09209 [Blattella germanica]